MINFIARQIRKWRFKRAVNNTLRAETEWGGHVVDTGTGWGFKSSRPNLPTDMTTGDFERQAMLQEPTQAQIDRWKLGEGSFPGRN